MGFIPIKAVIANSTSTTIKDVYALGHISEQTDASGNPLATFTYEASGRPASVVLGNPSTGTRYYYVYNGHSDVVALTDSSGTVVASYSYDAFGVLLSSSESFPGGWSNPYRFDGADLVRYDSETGLYWMSVRAYDPTLGRFISHDPLGRLAAEGIDFAPYVYTGNNPVVKVDPSGQRYTCGANDCGSPGCPSGQQWDGHACVNPSTKTTPPPVTPTPTPTGTPGINHCDPGTHSDGKGGCASDQQTGQCGNDIQCHGNKSKGALDTYYSNKMTEGSILTDALNILLDVLQIGNFAKLWDGGAINMIIQLITTIGDAVHLVADLMIKFNDNKVSVEARNLLNIGDFLHTISVFANGVWAGLGWLGAVSGVLDSLLAPELAPVVIGLTAAGLLVQFIIGGVQWYFIDQPRIEQSQVDNDMNPAQQYAACQAQFGVGSASC